MGRITELDVNGSRQRLDADADRTLLSVLRDDLDLTGAKYGCGEYYGPKAIAKRASNEERRRNARRAVTASPAEA